MPRVRDLRLDPVKYETFLHRLWAIGEEGRASIQRVTASPIVSQGGECMASFYTAEGTMILACSGHLRFAAATSDAIKKLIEWYSRSPGFFDGDQFFFNDPYVAGAHTFDMMIIKPVFYRNNLVAWVSSSIHTADTGGVLRGLASEIYHEGIRIQGMKLVEKGEFREDVFRCLTQQCRDPDYVGLDLKSQVASNNVCAKRYVELAEKLGLDFVGQAGAKMIADSERLARARLRKLPNGKWFSRVFGTAWDRREGKVKEYLIACAMSKEGDDLLLDFTGTSAEMTDSTNSTLAGTIAQIAVVMTDFLFWDVPWSDGRLRPVKVHVPEGSILNCTFPAACGGAPGVGVQAKIAVSDCIARMLYGAGYQDINAPWQGIWYTGGPGYFYGGHNRDGIPVAQGLYDGHGSGLGATPTRDGVHCGGNMNIPSGGISDVERIEMQYPFLYFTRNFHPDGGGSGKFNGGTGSFRIYMIYGSQDCSVSYSPYSRLPEGVGLFGGNPAGIGGVRAVYHTAGPALLQRLKTGQYPMQPDQIESGDWGTIAHPAEIKGRVNLPEFTIVADFVGGGGGYGDPIEREPDMVAKDVRRGIVSQRIAEKIHGVILIPSSLVPDNIATLQRRQEIREERIREGKPFSGTTSSLSDAVRKSTNWEQIVKFHEYLAIARNGKTEAIRCLRCGHLFCRKYDNYKCYALRRERDLYDLAQRLVPSGEPYLGGYLEYYCPGCATLLQVDGYCDAFPNSKEPLHDFYQQP
ncbi:MAG: hydantoinase B/oxoprolinase family protein [Deltaproteobacteria bacterium]|nr:hydantoinase B/oxoprolinase family protein [Deltaproteobacteria bacterium]